MNVIHNSSHFVEAKNILKIKFYLSKKSDSQNASRIAFLRAIYENKVIPKAICENETREIMGKRI